MKPDHVKMLFDISELNSLFTNTVNIESFLQKIVKLVAEHIHTDVCSIYILESQTNELVLKATKGLNLELVNKVKLKIGEGLVGTALKELTTISENEGKLNPHFKHIPGLNEEDFKSFLAVPILQGNYRIGVLVVQRKEATPFSNIDTLALKTSATQLASMCANISAMISTDTEIEDTLEEIPVSDLKLIKGKVAAEGYSYSAIKILESKNYYLSDNNIKFNLKYSLKDFEKAIVETEKQLDDLQKKVEEKLSDAASLIFAAHLLMLKDKSLTNKIKTLIEKNTNPPEAVIKVFSEYRNIFLNSPELIIREKAQDLEDLATRILENLTSNEKKQEKFEDHIVITEEIFPSELLKLSAENISGLIMVAGGTTSHIAILARSLQIPLIIADNSNLFKIDPSTKILMDAHVGNIYLNPSNDIIETFNERNIAKQKISESLDSFTLPIKTTDNVKINIMANINLLSDLNVIDNELIDGIGLYRTEFPFLIRNNFPSEEEQYIIYKKLIDSIKDKPITFRTLDIGGDKVLSYYDKTHEQNPFLGMRSIRFSLTHLDIFKQQIRAILRAGVDSKIKIMFPMIASVDDFKTCKQIVIECYDNLKQQNLKICENFEIGIMIELPSAVMIIDDLASVADFFSIGTNDLVQYTLAVDRTNEKVAHLYQPHHPAVLRSLKIVAESAKKHNIDISICGDMAAYQQYIPFLLGIGIRTLSIGTTYIPKVIKLISKLSLDESKEISKEMLSKKEISQIAEIINKFIDEKTI